MSDSSRVGRHLSALIGAQCWTVIGDQHPDVLIGLGGKVRRAKPLANATLTEEERHWRPALDIFVQCSRRLQSTNCVVAVASDGWDLAVRFSGDLLLMVFADETREGYDNFSVGVQDVSWTVTSRSLMTWE